MTKYLCVCVCNICIYTQNLRKTGHEFESKWRDIEKPRAGYIEMDIINTNI